MSKQEILSLLPTWVGWLRVRSNHFLGENVGRKGGGGGRYKGGKKGGKRVKERVFCQGEGGGGVRRRRGREGMFC